MRFCGECERGRNGGVPGTADPGTGHLDDARMITLQSVITLAYYALTAGAAALLVYNFVKAKSWEREVLYLIVLVPFLLRVFHLK
jgi:hypothetical protein